MKYQLSLCALLLVVGNVTAALDFDAGDVERSQLDPSVESTSLELAANNIYIERVGESYNVRFPVQHYFKGASLNMRAEAVLRPLKKLSNFILSHVEGPIYLKGVFVNNHQLNIDQRALVRSQISELADFLWKDRLFASAVFMTTKEVQKNSKLGFWVQNRGYDSFVEIKFKAYPGMLPFEFEN